MIEVFKTNVREEQREELIGKLRDAFPQLSVNFDLEDRDRILRVAGARILNEEIKALLEENKIYCEVLN